jgi:dTDP-4-amino-4,6-dideoxygalactose transaminase
MSYTIPFNKPFLVGAELRYIRQAVLSGKLSGDGQFSKRCAAFFEQRWGFQKALLTTSCTDALEMAAILANIQPGDEVVAPSYTFVSSVNAFVLRGAKIVFVDSQPGHPNIDVNALAQLITPKTKAIVVVHYAGVACDMDAVMQLAAKHNLLVVEDAAHAIDSYYRDRPLGGIGDVGCFSFHETKNVIAGEGGLLTINNPDWGARAEIIREKGTNRSAFFRGETDRYNWVDIGSSFLPGELTAAFLYAQLENIEKIQAKRLHIWHFYYEHLSELAQKGFFQLPSLPDYATNNAHMFYILCRSLEERSALIEHLKKAGILAVFHYLSLHRSPFYRDKHDGRALPHSDFFTDHLLRLPLYFQLTDRQLDKITKQIKRFFL